MLPTVTPGTEQSSRVRTSLYAVPVRRMYAIEQRGKYRLGHTRHRSATPALAARRAGHFQLRDLCRRLSCFLPWPASFRVGSLHAARKDTIHLNPGSSTRRGRGRRDDDRCSVAGLAGGARAARTPRIAGISRGSGRSGWSGRTRNGNRRSRHGDDRGAVTGAQKRKREQADYDEGLVHDGSLESAEGVSRRFEMHGTTGRCMAFAEPDGSYAAYARQAAASVRYRTHKGRYCGYAQDGDACNASCARSSTSMRPRL